MSEFDTHEELAGVKHPARAAAGQQSPASASPGGQHPPGGQQAPGGGGRAVRRRAVLAAFPAVAGAPSPRTSPRARAAGAAWGGRSPPMGIGSVAWRCTAVESRFDSDGHHGSSSVAAKVSLLGRQRDAGSRATDRTLGWC